MTSAQPRRWLQWYSTISGLEKTIQSTRRQLRNDLFFLSHIIVDGESTDGTVEFASTLSDIHFVSEPDSGIYDAMNKGAQIANSLKANYCLFLNSGDQFCSDRSLFDVFIATTLPVLSPLIAICP